MGIDCTHVFASDEITLLKRYGYWLEALGGRSWKAELGGVHGGERRLVLLTQFNSELPPSAFYSADVASKLLNNSVYENLQK